MTRQPRDAFFERGKTTEALTERVDEPGRARRAMAAGMNDHVSKPINVKELFSALGRWVEKRETITPDDSFPSTASRVVAKPTAPTLCGRGSSGIRPLSGWK